MHDQQQQEQQPGQWTPLQDARNGISILVLAAQVFSAPLEVMLRKNFGKNYFGWPSFLALFAIPMWMLFYPGEDPEPIMIFWCLFVLMQFRARIESGIRSARGKGGHTRYNGEPSLMRFFPKLTEKKAKATESLIVMLIGVFMLAVSEPLGTYLMASGFCLGLVGSMIESSERAKTEQMHDAWLEQEQLAERFRKMQRNGRW